MPEDDVLSVTADEEGWVRCPRCDIRFTARDRRAWTGRRHRRCGQRLRLEVWDEPRTVEPPSPAYTRGLYRALLDYDGENLGRDLLIPWAVASRDELRQRLSVAFEPFGQQPVWGASPALQEISWEMYALGRVADVLLLPHQPEPLWPLAGYPGELLPASPAPYGTATLDEIAQFFGAFGMRVDAGATDFDPFFHEI